MKHFGLARRHAKLSVMVVALLIGTLGLSGVAGAQSASAPTPPDKAGVISSGMQGVTVAAPRPWTAAEMRAAQPYPMISASGAARETGAVHKPDGPSGNLLPVAPKAGNAAKPIEDPTQQSYPVNPSSYPYFPYSAVGRLFFYQNGVGPYSCTASMIKGHAIWTAGHCAHAGNNSSAGWSYNAVFVPQYYYGSAPLGNCYVTSWWTTTDWYTYGNPDGLDNDFAGGNVSCDIADISYYTGYLGLAWNYGYGQYWSAVGYPAGAPFTGMYQVQCDGGLAAYGFGSPTTFGIVCDMTGGSSGGPWIMSGAYVNGNTSYSDSRYPGLLFSPYFTDLVYSLWLNLTA